MYKNFQGGCFNPAEAKMKFQLIPCPDCGSAAEVKEACYLGTAQVYSYAHCTNPLCHLFSHNIHFTASTPEKSDEFAACSWNDRYAETECPDRATPQ
jgi:hypothetical protein